MTTIIEPPIDKAWANYAKQHLKDDGEHIVEYSLGCMEEAFRAGAFTVVHPTPDSSLIEKLEALPGVS